MTGPPYPPAPVAGSNAIGSFVIGVSPIGTIPAFDPLRTVISQYANSPIMMAMIEDFFDSVDQTADMEAFFDNIWNLDTAVGYGLDVWGRIVGVSRIIQVTGADQYFGFSQAVGGDSIDTFDFAAFYSGFPITNNFSLSDPAFRTLINAKALSNISDGSIPNINLILRTLFPDRGNCYVIDNLDMTMTYKFNFVLSAVEVAIVVNSGALPKPVGVAFDIEQTV